MRFSPKSPLWIGFAKLILPLLAAYSTISICAMLIQGEQKAGKGRPKQYEGKIEIKNVSTKHFNIIRREEKEIVYEGALSKMLV